MSDATKVALQVAVLIALQQLDRISEADRESVLVAAIEVLPEHQARAAQDALHAIREARRLQMVLVGILPR